MDLTPQIRVPATYMRGGTSKGIFFHLDDLPLTCQVPGPDRDALLLRVMGSPDPYGKQIDGMGGATSSTSKAAIISRSERSGHDIDYLFGQVAIDKALVDWSGNCGNLSAAVGAFSIYSGLIDNDRIPTNGLVHIRIWQANIGKTIIVQVPITDGQVQETGDFILDGVTFPAAELEVTFMDPASGNALFPTGNLVDQLTVPGLGIINATLIDAGIPTIFINAQDIDYNGTELQDEINRDSKALEKFEAIRAHGAVTMGLIKHISEASYRQHIPKIAFVAPPAAYIASNGQLVAQSEVELLVRALSMGQLHHAMMGTAAVAIATAATIPGTLVNQAASGDSLNSVCFGHPSGTLKVGAETHFMNGRWQVHRVVMSRSARILMEGWVRVASNTQLH